MERLGILAAAFAVSLLAALGAAAQLADHYWYGEDFSLFVLPISVFVAMSIAAFGVAAAYARAEGTLRNVALVLAAVALALTLLPGLVGGIARRSTNPDVVLRAHDRLVATAFLVPVLIALAVQWMLVRRSWLRARGQDYRTVLPWITAVVACLLALSPFGLAVLGAAITQSSTDWFRGLWLMVALVFGGLVLLAGLIEWRIRTQMQRRRLAPQGP